MYLLHILSTFYMFGKSYFGTFKTRLNVHYEKNLNISAKWSVYWNNSFKGIAKVQHENDLDILNMCFLGTLTTFFKTRVYK